MLSSVSSMTEVVVKRRTTSYHWPAIQLNIWLFIMLVGASTILGINAYFLTVQQQLQVGTPWYFTYWVVVASLMIVFIILKLWLISQRQLLPGIVIMGSFILFVLWMVGMTVVSVQLWGSSGVNSTCQLYVNDMPSQGASVATLAWLEQRSICQSWIAAWAFELIGVIFLFWMMIMAHQVYSDL